MAYIFQHRFSSLFIGITLALIIAASIFFILLLAPKNFPTQQQLVIREGSGLRSVSAQLQQQGFIKNADFFTALAFLLGEQSNIKSGTYYFEEPENTFGVMETLTEGLFNVPINRVTVYEGEAAYEFSQRLEEKLENFDATEFNQLVTDRDLEGKLFPDTYLFPVTATAERVASIMNDNFESKIDSLAQEIAASPLALNEIITKASLIENEAGSADYETKRQVAGIINNRLERGMLLQIDAVFGFIYQRHLPRVLFEHLEVDSPYNTYKYTGLPPGPIGNPGIESIRAALDPAATNYLYYLTGNDGNFYYATTNSAHEQNRRQYLRY